MRKYLIAATIVLPLLSGCDSENSRAPEKMDQDANLREILKNAIRINLKDPQSAVFGDISIGKKFNGYDSKTQTTVEGRMACVSVNAKNSFGGYSGEQHFLLVNEAGKPWRVFSEYTTHSECVATQLKER